MKRSAAHGGVARRAVGCVEGTHRPRLAHVMRLGEASSPLHGGGGPTACLRPGPPKTWCLSFFAFRWSAPSAPPHAPRRWFSASASACGPRQNAARKVASKDKEAIDGVQRNPPHEPHQHERVKAVEGGSAGETSVTASNVSQGSAQVSPLAGYRLVERLAKRIARSGLCSRREAERLIEQGLVSVDGVVVKTPAINVTPTSVVTINNKKLEKTPPPQLWIHYKKRGVLVTHHDPQGREALFPHLQRMGLPHVISVGRLDYTSEGLLLLTNNGNLARYLEHPSNEFVRKYRVRIRGKVEQKVIDRLAQGITVGGVEYGPIKVQIIPKRGAEDPSTNQWIYVTLKEGKNREIRRVFEHFKLVVTRLIRVQYGPYKLDKKLEPGDVIESKLKLDLIKKADKYWWLWDGDLEASRVPFPDSYYRALDHVKALTSELPSPASHGSLPPLPSSHSPKVASLPSSQEEAQKKKKGDTKA